MTAKRLGVATVAVAFHLLLVAWVASTWGGVAAAITSVVAAFALSEAAGRVVVGGASGALVLPTLVLAIYALIEGDDMQRARAHRIEVVRPEGPPPSGDAFGYIFSGARVDAGRLGTWDERGSRPGSSGIRSSREPWIHRYEAAPVVFDQVEDAAPRAWALCEAASDGDRPSSAAGRALEACRQRWQRATGFGLRAPDRTLAGAHHAIAVARRAHGVPGDERGDLVVTWTPESGTGAGSLGIRNLALIGASFHLLFIAFFLSWGRARGVSRNGAPDVSATASAPSPAAASPAEPSLDVLLGLATRSPMAPLYPREAIELLHAHRQDPSVLASVRALFRSVDPRYRASVLRFAQNAPASAWTVEALRALAPEDLISALRELDLTRERSGLEPPLGVGGVDALVAALGDTPLRALDLGGQDVGRAGLARLAGSVLAGTLRHLDISDQDLDAEAIELLAGRPFPALETLVIERSAGIDVAELRRALGQGTEVVVMSPERRRVEADWRSRPRLERDGATPLEGIERFVWSGGQEGGDRAFTGGLDERALHEHASALDRDALLAAAMTATWPRRVTALRALRRHRPLPVRLLRWLRFLRAAAWDEEAVASGVNEDGGRYRDVFRLRDEIDALLPEQEETP